MIKKYRNYSQECKKQNTRLVEKNLSIQTFSNVSVKIDKKYFVIKPSGVPPQKININECPIISISNGKNVFGKYNPQLIHQLIKLFIKPIIILKVFHILILSMQQHGLKLVNQFQFMEQLIPIIGQVKFL